MKLCGSTLFTASGERQEYAYRPSFKDARIKFPGVCRRLRVHAYISLVSIFAHLDRTRGLELQVRPMTPETMRSLHEWSSAYEFLLSAAVGRPAEPLRWAQGTSWNCLRFRKSDCSFTAGLAPYVQNGDLPRNTFPSVVQSCVAISNTQHIKAIRRIDWGSRVTKIFLHLCALISPALLRANHDRWTRCCDKILRWCLCCAPGAKPRLYLNIKVVGVMRTQLSP